MRQLFKIYLFLFCLTAFSQLRFGPELTFTNQRLIDDGRRMGGSTYNSPANENALLDLSILIYDEAGDMVEEDRIRNGRGYNETRLIFEDGFVIDLTLDPWVIEINSTPISSNEMDERVLLFDEFIFDRARRLNLHPSYDIGGGHIHVGATELLRGDEDVLRDILVDFYNHRELGEGLLGNNRHNAPSIQSLPLANRNAFKEIIAHVDAYEIAIEDFAIRMNEEVYSVSGSHDSMPEKFQGVNVTRLADDSFSESERTVEFRFFRPQQNMSQFSLQTVLLEKRFQFLKNQRESGIVNQPEDISELSREDKFTRFVSYINEIGDRPIKYFRLLGSSYLPLVWQYITVSSKDPLNVQKKLILELSEDLAFDDLYKLRFIIAYLKQVQTIESEHKQILRNIYERLGRTQYMRTRRQLNLRLWGDAFSILDESLNIRPGVIDNISLGASNCLSILNRFVLQYGR